MAESVSTTFTFNSDKTIPKIALGTWQAAGSELHSAVSTAVKAGYRSIDTAEVYENEQQIGDALKEIYDQGVVSFLETNLIEVENNLKFILRLLEKTYS